MTRDLEAAARTYGAYFETLQPDNVERLRDLATPEICFEDPFNEVRGVDQVIRLLHRMFEDATEVSFRMLDQACRPKRLSKGRIWRIEGVSMVRFDEHGRVAEHIDYWDAARQIYGRLPLIGALLRIIGRRLKL